VHIQNLWRRQVLIVINIEEIIVADISGINEDTSGVEVVVKVTEEVTMVTKVTIINMGMTMTIWGTVVITDVKLEVVLIAVPVAVVTIILAMLEVKVVGH
jgi:hypothetical protein